LKNILTDGRILVLFEINIIEGGVLIPRRVRNSRRIFTIKLEIYCCCKPLRGGRTSFVKRHTHGPWRRVLELRGEVHLSKRAVKKEGR
jgi:hypothetical protein